MGPIVSPWTAVSPSRRWLVLLVIPAGLALALSVPGRAPVRARATATLGPPQGLEAAQLRLDQLARAHRSWVADHGAGCARALDHLAPYTRLALTDPWGRPLDLRCDRLENEGEDEILVEVRSPGPDRVRGTTDDLVGRDVQVLGPTRR